MIVSFTYQLVSQTSAEENVLGEFYLERKMFWGSFTWKGVWSLVPVEGMINTDRYIDVLRRRAFIYLFHFI